MGDGRVGDSREGVSYGELRLLVPYTESGLTLARSRLRPQRPFEWRLSRLPLLRFNSSSYRWDLVFLRCYRRFCRSPQSLCAALLYPDHAVASRKSHHQASARVKVGMVILRCRCNGSPVYRFSYNLSTTLEFSSLTCAPFPSLYTSSAPSGILYHFASSLLTIFHAPLFPSLPHNA